MTSFNNEFILVIKFVIFKYTVVHGEIKYVIWQGITIQYGLYFDIQNSVKNREINRESSLRCRLIQIWPRNSEPAFARLNTYRFNQKRVILNYARFKWSSNVLPFPFVIWQSSFISVGTTDCWNMYRLYAATRCDYDNVIILPVGSNRCTGIYRFLSSITLLKFTHPRPSFPNGLS